MGHLLDRALPTAIAYGMTPEQYWNEDPWLFAAYARASRDREENAQWARWTSGMYVYDALCRAAGLYNPFSKTHRAMPWVERPYEVAKPPEAERPQEDEQVNHQRMIDWMLMHGPSN